MPRRLVLLLGSVATVAALAVAVWAVWPRASAISEESARRIRVGMTLSDVEAILGGEERDESTGPIEADDPVIDGSVPAGVVQASYWKTDRLMVRTDLDRHGRVACVVVQPVRRQREGPLDFLRRWLGL